MASIRKRGSRWQVQIRRQGYPQLIKSFITRDDAMRWARLREIEFDRGYLPDEHARNDDTIMTLLGRYEQEITPKKRSAASEIFHLRQIKRHPISALMLSDLKSEHVAKFRNDRLLSVSNPTVRKELNLLSNILKIAMNEWGYPNRNNPVGCVRKPPSGRSRDRRLTDAEYSRLYAAIVQCRNPLIGFIIKFAVSTGMRRSEILALEWRNINLGDRTTKIKMSKNGEPRTIPLSSSAIDVLQQLIKSGCDPEATSDVHNGLLFPVAANALRLSWDRICKRANIIDFHFHDLRHEAISRFFELGLSMPEVSLISGHKDVRMLFRYTHLKASDTAKKLLNT